MTASSAEPRLSQRCGCAAASVKIMYQAQPTPELIKGLAEKNIRVVACGHNHTLALDDANAAYTWGECIFPHLPATDTCLHAKRWLDRLAKETAKKVLWVDPVTFCACVDRCIWDLHRRCVF